MQALPTAEPRLLYSDWHLLSGLLPLLLQAAVEPDCGQHIQPGFWAAQVLGHSNSAGQCSAAAGFCGVAVPQVSVPLWLPRGRRAAKRLAAVGEAQEQAPRNEKLLAPVERLAQR